VEDDGCGMDEPTLARIFDPFFTTKGNAGTGLGLPVVQAIVAGAGGAIEVESRPGRGTRFRVRLPRCDEVLDALREEDELASVKGVETVLLVEDDASVRGLARRSLEREGYRVLAACDPAEARDVLSDHPAFDVLVTDVIMPGQSGPALARDLAAARPGLPVVFMSGYVDDEARRLLDGGVDVLQKPFTPRALAARVRRALDAGALRPGTR
jgi:CheY-like chemotaxis protein